MFAGPTRGVQDAATRGAAHSGVADARTRPGRGLRALAALAVATVTALVPAGTSGAQNTASGGPDTAPGGPDTAPGGQNIGNHLDVPDPFILPLGDRYVAYSTNVAPAGRMLNVPVLTSADLVSWSRVGDALPLLPGWAQPGRTWAPSVRPARGGFVLYFTATHRDSGHQCIGSAVSASPVGPFAPVGDRPLVCEHGAGGSIDPEPFTAADGRSWLLWKTEGTCCGATARLVAQRLDLDGSLVGRPATLLTARRGWERRVVENPTVVERDGAFHLFYSGGSWGQAGYGTGHAVCEDLAGPCTRRSTDAPVFANAPDTTGNGGMSTFTGRDGRLMGVLHGWAGDVVGSERGGSRVLRIGYLTWIGGRPHVAWSTREADIQALVALTVAVDASSSEPVPAAAPTPTGPNPTESSSTTTPATDPEPTSEAGGALGAGPVGPAAEGLAGSRTADGASALGLAAVAGLVVVGVALLPRRRRRSRPGPSRA